MGQNVNYDSETILKYGGNIRRFEYSFALICPKIYVDAIRNYYWRDWDIDLIEESLGILIR